MLINRSLPTTELYSFTGQGSLDFCEYNDIYIVARYVKHNFNSKAAAAAFVYGVLVYIYTLV